MAWWWPFGRRGWRTVRAEGCSIEMPAAPARRTQDQDRTEGTLHLVTFNAKAENAFTCQLTIRSGSSIELRSDAELFEAWKTEFRDSMAALDTTVELRSETPLTGGSVGRDLTYSAFQGNVSTRVRLLRDVTRLIVLTAIGPPQRVAVDGERFVTSFRFEEK